MQRRCWMLLPLSGCQFIEEVRTAPDAISWGGTVQVDRSFSTGELEDLVDGTVTMSTPDGTLIAEATQPFADSPGYWRFDDIPVDEPVAIRVAGDGVTPMVWRATVPTGTALWFTGALFAREPDVHQAYFEALDGLDNISAADPSDGDVAALWGEPIDPDEWAGATITVTDGDGVQAPVWRLSIDEQGQLAEAGDGPVNLFIAPNLAPGIVTLEVAPVDGTPSTTQWPAQGGDMISAIFYDLETP